MEGEIAQKVGEDRRCMSWQISFFKDHWRVGRRE